MSKLDGFNFDPEEFFELSAGFVESVFRDDPKANLNPALTLAIQKHDGCSVHRMLFAEFNDTRFNMVKDLGAKYGREGQQVLAAVVESEGWMSRIAKEDYDGHVENRVPPSEDPNRIEVVMVAGMAIDGQQFWRNYEIKRDQVGAATLETMSEPEAMNSDDLIEVDNYLLKQFFIGFAGGYLKFSQQAGRN